MSSGGERILTDSMEMEQIGERPKQNGSDMHQNGRITHDESPDDDVDGGRCYVPHRYVLFILIFMLTAVVFMHRTSFTFALVCMVNTTDAFNESDSCPAGEVDNSSAPITDGEFDWSPKIQSTVLSSFYYAYVILQFPGGYVAERYGSKWVIFVCVFIPGVLYMLVPTVARISVYGLIGMQAMAGLCSGALYPAMYSMWAKWAPEKQRTMLIGNSMNGLIVGELIASGVTGFLCDSSFLGGWPAVFYIFGGFEVLFCVFWVIFAQNSPASDPTISTEEKLYIESGTANLDHAKFKTPPYLSIITSPRVWAILVISITDAFWFYVIFSTLPIYMRHILHFSNTQIGIAGMAPIASSFIGCSIFPIIADFLRAKGILSTTATRKLLSAIGTLVMAGVFILIPFAGCDKVMVLSAVIISSFINGGNMGGYIINGNDIAPQFAGTLSGICNTFANFCGFLSPLVVESLSGLSTSLSGWTDVFYVTTALIVVGGLFFIIFGSGEVQAWAVPEIENSITVSADDEVSMGGSSDSGDYHKEPLPSISGHLEDYSERL